MRTLAENIETLSAHLDDAYVALSAKGATIPTAKNAANLSAAIDSIQAGGGEAETLKGYIKQLMEYGMGNALNDDDLRECFCSQVETICEKAHQGITYQGDLCFPNCKLVAQDAFSQWNTYDIGEYYEGYSKVASLNFPVCEEVSYQSFYDCPYLTAIYLPRCTRFGEFCFNWCERLLDIYLDSCSKDDVRLLITENCILGDSMPGGIATYIHCSDGMLRTWFDYDQYQIVIEDCDE